MTSIINHLTTYFAEFKEARVTDIITFTAPMVIGVFTLSFPLLFQAIISIDSKYKSDSITEYFYEENLYKWFRRFLIVNLFVAIFCVLQKIGLIPSERTFLAITHHLLLLLLIVLISLVFKIVNLTRIYYSPRQLFTLYQARYNSNPHVAKKLFFRIKYEIPFNVKTLYYELKEKCQVRDKESHTASQTLPCSDDLFNGNNDTKLCPTNYEEEKAFRVISKLFLYSIQSAEKTIEQDLLLFYSNAFKHYREGKTKQKIEYPSYFYTSLDEVNNLLCTGNFYRRSNPIYRWFIDEYQETIIGEATFKFLWRCLCQAILYGKDEFITSYWSTAHQYIEIYLQDIRAEYDDSNEAELKSRVEARERFLEFHYALGGFLLMQGKLSLLAKLMAYSNSFPPRYVLVPEAMEEVISRFMSIEREENHANFMYYTINYSFPGIDGVNSDEIIKRWIKRYFAILFLRQYTLPEIYSHSNRLSTPTPPDKLREIRKWIDELEFLAKDTQEYLENEEYLKALNLGVLVAEGWFDKSNRPSPENLIDGFKQSLETEYKNIKENQPPAEEKLNQFNSHTRERLVHCLREYEALEASNDRLPDSRHRTISFEGKSQIQDKMAFALDQDISYLNWDSILAEAIAKEFQYNMPQIFGEFSERLPYKVKGENILPAIQKLNLSKDEYTIVSIGIDLNSYRDLYKWEDVFDSDNGWNYKGIPIISLNYTPISDLNRSFFVMRNEDLPSIIYRKPDENTIQRYKLKEIDSEYHIYTNVLDLKEEREIKEDIHGYTDLDKSVLVYVALEAEISCKVGAKCIQLQVFSLFDDTGNPDDLASIKNIL